MHVDLDDVFAVRNLDTEGLYNQLRDVPELMVCSYHEAQKFVDTFSGKHTDIHEIVLCGVGGGPISSLLQLRAMLFDQSPVPIFVTQAYAMPAFVDEHSLVFIVNYSGGSEEVVSAHQDALQRGAQIVAVTTGGAVRALAVEHKHPFFEMIKGKNPRFCSSGAVLVPILLTLHQRNLIEAPDRDIAATITSLRRLSDQYGVDMDTQCNLAKQMAIEMDGFIPVVYGTSPFTESVATRFKNQLSESAKVMAFSNALSGLNHDEAYGWDADSAVFKQFFFTLIHDIEDHPRMQRRLRATYDVLKRRAGGVNVVSTEGESRLERLCSLGYLFDHVSMYMAARRGINPASSKAVNEFREIFSKQ